MVPASVKAGRRRVSAAEACLRSCGLTRYDACNRLDQVAAFQGAGKQVSTARRLVL